MEVKQENSPTLDEIYTDICAINTKKTMSDSPSSVNDRATPTGSLPHWEVSPVPQNLHANLLHLRPLSSGSRVEDTPPHSEYYIGCPESMPQPSPTGYHDWGQTYEWEYFSGHCSQSSKHDINSSFIDNGNNCYKSTVNQVSMCNVQQQYGGDIEYTRCSTPELITALASLQPENKDHCHTHTSTSSQYNCGYSTPTHNNSMDSVGSENVSVVQEHGSSAMFMHLAHRYQDSGYNSDLSMSPVYPYNSKNTAKISQDTSQSDEEGKENSGYLHGGDINLSQYVPKFSSLEKSAITVSQSGILSSLPKLYCLPHKEKQIQSNDVSSSDHHPSTIMSKAIHRLPPLQPTLKLTTKRPIQHHVREVPSKHRKVDMSMNAGHENDHVKRQKQSTMVNQIQENNQGNQKMHRMSEADRVKKQRHNQPLNVHATEIMMKWYESQRSNPYPTKAEKEMMAREGGITVTQVKSWFANKRNRNNNTRPKVQKRQMTERLMEICHQLARNGQHPSMNNADIIQKLSTIITTNPEEEM